MNIIKKLKYFIKGEVPTEELIKRGMVVGHGFKRMSGVILDDSHAWLIEIGNNVTIAPRAHILCHDASTKVHLGYTKIGRVTIGDNVFIGAESVVLPGVTIGNNSIIGANSTVTKDVPENMVYGGSPAKQICSLKGYLAKEQERMKHAPVYGEEYTMRKKVSAKLRMKQKQELKNRIGYII